MEKISQLMDGELDEKECSAHLRRLAQDPDLAHGWGTFHLIRDVLCDEASCGYELAERVRQRLAKEPTVIAPHTRLPARIVRHTMPIAAAVAGVIVVGWLAVSLTGAPSGPTDQIAKNHELPPVDAKGKMSDYILAHQEYSPGVVPYIRTVANEDSDAAR